MAKTAIIFLALALLVLATACETMDSVMEGADTVKGVTDRAGSVSAKAGAVDFKAGEQLCAYTDRDSAVDNNFRAAKILTEPSDGTQNQAEVLFTNGDRKWTRFVLRTHKPSKSELTVGTLVLYMPYYSDDEDVRVEAYRDSDWRFGTVTSTDDLFKDMVEVDGDPAYVKWLRIPDEPVG
jgi:hypothetical protein